MQLAAQLKTVIPVKYTLPMPDEPQSDDELPTKPSPPSGKAPRVISSDELLLGRREVWIEHDGEMYRLRVTGNGKLYLSK